MYRFFYCRQVLPRYLFLPILPWWKWRVPGDDGIKVLRRLGFCSLGISDGLLVFT